MSGGGEFRLDYAADLGAYRQLAKPFTQQQLLAAITAVLAAYPPGSGPAESTKT